MKLDSVRALKAEVSAEIVASPDGDPAIRSFYAATEPPFPAGLALGVARRDDGEHVVAIRTADPAAAAAIAARAHGEADTRIVTIAKRVTPAFLQGTVRPLEPVAQVNIRGANFVGTLGAFVRDSRGVYALYQFARARRRGPDARGHGIGQPFGSSPIGEGQATESRGAHGRSLRCCT